MFGVGGDAILKAGFRFPRGHGVRPAPTCRRLRAARRARPDPAEAARKKPSPASRPDSAACARETLSCWRRFRSCGAACSPRGSSNPAGSRARPSCAKCRARATARYFRAPRANSRAPRAPGRKSARSTRDCACAASPSCRAARRQTAPRLRALRCAADGEFPARCARATRRRSPASPRYCACRSRSITCEVIGAVASPSRWQIFCSISGPRCVQVPTAPEIFPTAICARPLQSARRRGDFPRTSSRLSART